MGYSIAWILVRGKTKEDILAQLGLADAAAPDDFVGNQVAVAALPEGAYLLCFSDMAHPATQASSMARVSKGCEALGCQAEDNVMASAAFFYKDGAKVWDVVHLADQGLYHLEVNGAPPPLLDTIHAAMKAAQDEEGGEGAQVDWLFEAPLMLANALGGYRHDEGLLSGDALVFTALAATAASGGRH